jgi:uncharacterized membrane protein
MAEGLKIPRVCCVLAMLLALAACGPATSSDTAATPTPTSTPTGTLADRACPTNSILTYADFGAPFMSNHCTSCHASTVTGDERRGAPAGFDFDTLAGIQSHADRIYARAADGYAEMPPAGGPAAVERLELGDWLACGTP